MSTDDILTERLHRAEQDERRTATMSETTLTKDEIANLRLQVEALEAEKESDWNGQARWQGYLNDLRDARQATTNAQAERDALAAQLTEVTRENLELRAKIDGARR